MRGASSSRFTVSPALTSNFLGGFVVGVVCFVVLGWFVFFVLCLCLPSRFRDHFSCLPERTTVGAVMARTAWEKKKGRRQGYNCNLGTRDFLVADRATTAICDLVVFWWQAQLEGDRAITAIWELEVFLVAGPVGRPSWKVTGPQLQSGVAGQLEGDRAITAIWELEVFLVAGPVGRPSWKVTGPQLATTAIRELEMI